MLLTPLTLALFLVSCHKAAGQECDPDFQVPACAPGGIPPLDFVLPHLTKDALNIAIPDSALPTMDYPEHIFIAGGSKGIGRGIACYFANLPTTKKIISIAATDILKPESCGSEAADAKVRNYIYDISTNLHLDTKDCSSSGCCNTSIPSILHHEEIETIDLLVLGAARDLVGQMRYWSGDDLLRGLANNLVGLHSVWQATRDYLNPAYAVVQGVSSVASETRFFSMRSFYHMSKQALADLILGYAVEEAEVQPNTHYAVIYQGDTQTSFSLEQITPLNLDDDCRQVLANFGKYSNSFLQAFPGNLSPEETAKLYHKIYVIIAIAAASPGGLPGPGGIPTGIPQTFSIEPNCPFTPILNMQFNHRLLSPNAVNLCYDQVWDAMATNPAIPFNFYADPRADLKDPVDVCEIECEEARTNAPVDPPTDDPTSEAIFLKHGFLTVLFVAIGALASYVH